MKATVAHLGLGTNLGDRTGNLRKALELLTAQLSAQSGLRLLRCSQVYETEPWGVADQPPFLNCVAEISTTLDPEGLLAVCKEVERQMGRQPGLRWGPRPIDIDVLLFGDLIVRLPHLEIPHPRLHLRAFALIPLAELVPDTVHPGTGRTIRELTDAVEGRDGVAPNGGTLLAVDDGEC